LSKKNRVSREDGPRFVFAYVVARFLERASTRRSLALFAERGSFRNPLGFLCILHVNFGAVVCNFPLGSSGFVVVIFFPRPKIGPQKLFEAFTHFGRGRRWDSGLFTLSKLESSKQASCQNIALHMSAWDNGTRLEVSFRRFFSSRVFFSRVLFLSGKTNEREGNARARDRFE